MNFYFATCYVGARTEGVTVKAADWTDAESVAIQRMEKANPRGDVVVVALKLLTAQNK